MRNVQQILFKGKQKSGSIIMRCWGGGRVRERVIQRKEKKRKENMKCDAGVMIHIHASSALSWDEFGDKKATSGSSTTGGWSSTAATPNE